MSEPVLTVANQLTMLRMAMVPLLVLLALAQEFVWALVVFVARAADRLVVPGAQLAHGDSAVGEAPIHLPPEPVQEPAQ